MGVNLAKGSNVSLTKAAPGLTAVYLGLGWDARTTDGASFDLDASALGVGTDGKIVEQGYFVFYNNKRSPDGSIEHGGDSLTGEGSGDDERIVVNLAAVPPRSRRLPSPSRSTTRTPSGCRSARSATPTSG